jgi:hypothetical protein
MSEACSFCGGVGYGVIGDTGYVDNGEPCPSCSSRFDRYVKSAGASIVDGEKTKRAELTFGRYIEPPKAAPSQLVTSFVDGEPRRPADSQDERAMTAQEVGFSPADIARSAR